MTNKSTVTIEGKEYVLMMRARALRIYQDLTGSSFLANEDEIKEIFGDVEIDKETKEVKKRTPMNTKKFLAFLQACLMNGDRELTLQQAEEIVDMADLTDEKIYRSLTDLFATEKNATAPQTSGAM
jgi:hypothetical protein